MARNSAVTRLGKEVAFSMGARYGADGWYAPPRAYLDAFREWGWL